MDTKESNMQETLELELAAKEVIAVLEKYNLYLYSNFWHNLVLAAGDKELVLSSERIT